MTDETRDRESRGGYGQPRDVDWTGDEDAGEDASGEGSDSGDDPEGDSGDESEGDAVESPPSPVTERDRLEPSPPSQRPRDAHPDVVERC